MAYILPPGHKESGAQFATSNYQGGRGVRTPYRGRVGRPLRHGRAKKKEGSFAFGGLKTSLGSKAASKKQAKPDVEQKEVSDGLGTAQRPIPCDWDGWWVLLSTTRVGNLDDPEVDLARGPRSCAVAHGSRLWAVACEISLRSCRPPRWSTHPQ